VEEWEKQKLLFFVKLVYDITHFGVLFFFDDFLRGVNLSIGFKSVVINKGILF